MVEDSEVVEAEEVKAEVSEAEAEEIEGVQHKIAKEVETTEMMVIELV